ncbi:helix-turn-helix domain-containing protein [uncultured Tateyamaria sp.]|uniref:helix-turn-helix domain-containing protein n=1 Tax=uncultured Tateyamaria sp. TaxID=455651 RepID=UPI00262F3F80|nr:helix-turn-helix domain-containing protein [uncultured Tateyamaria sp.]
MLITTNPDDFGRQLIETEHDVARSNLDKGVEESALKSAINALAVQSATILNAIQAAELLHCSIDTLRRVSIDELPTYDGVGRSALYLKEDIEKYVRGRKRYAKRGTGLGSMAERSKPSPFVSDHNPADIALLQLKGS